MMDITAAFIISGRKLILSTIAPAIEKSITYMHNFKLAMSALSTESDNASEVAMSLTLSLIFLLLPGALSAKLLGVLRILSVLFFFFMSFIYTNLVTNIAMNAGSISDIITVFARYLSPRQLMHI